MQGRGREATAELMKMERCSRITTQEQRKRGRDSPLAICSRSPAAALLSRSNKTSRSVTRSRHSGLSVRTRIDCFDQRTGIRNRESGVTVHFSQNPCSPAQLFTRWPTGSLPPLFLPRMRSSRWRVVMKFWSEKSLSWTD